MRAARFGQSPAFVTEVLVPTTAIGNTVTLEFWPVQTDVVTVTRMTSAPLPMRCSRVRLIIDAFGGVYLSAVDSADKPISWTDDEYGLMESAPWRPGSVKRPTPPKDQWYSEWAKGIAKFPDYDLRNSGPG